MPKEDLPVELGPNELAFHFICNDGVSADRLGVFLQRTATVARRADIELKVVALHDGSLTVVMTALTRSTKAIGAEYSKSPLQATAAVSVIVAALVTAMEPAGSQVQPIAKAGAEIVTQEEVERIEIITVERSVVVMDLKRAQIIKETTSISKELQEMRTYSFTSPARTSDMAQRAIEGNLSGVFIDVEGELHFRPSRYNYIVPVRFSPNFKGNRPNPGTQLTIHGEVKFISGVPDHIVIETARQDTE